MKRIYPFFFLFASLLIGCGVQRETLRYDGDALTLQEVEDSGSVRVEGDYLYVVGYSFVKTEDENIAQEIAAIDAQLKMIDILDRASDYTMQKGILYLFSFVEWRTEEDEEGYCIVSVLLRTSILENFIMRKKILRMEPMKPKYQKS